MIGTVNFDLQKILLGLFLVLLVLYIGKWLMYGLGWSQEDFQTPSVSVVMAADSTNATGAQETPTLTVTSTPTAQEIEIIPESRSQIIPETIEPVSMKSETWVPLPTLDAYLNLDEEQRKKLFKDLNKKLEVAAACAGNIVCLDEVKDEMPVTQEVLQLFDYLLNIRQQQEYPLKFEEFDGLMKMILNGEIIIA